MNMSKKVLFKSYKPRIIAALIIGGEIFVLAAWRQYHFLENFVNAFKECRLMPNNCTGSVREDGIMNICPAYALYSCDGFPIPKVLIAIGIWLLFSMLAYLVISLITKVMRHGN